MLDYEIESIMPFQTLRRGMKTNRAMSASLLPDFPPNAAWEGVRCAQPSVVATAVSVMLAPFLTVVASGLFTVNIIPSSEEIGIKPAQHFNPLIPVNLSSSDYTTAGVVALYDVPFPQSTYEGLSIPQFIIEEEPGFPSVEDATMILYDTLALRGQLNCSKSEGKFEVNVTKVPGPLGGYISQVNLWAPSGATKGNHDDNDPQMIALQPSQAQGYFGQVFYRSEIQDTYAEQPVLVFGQVLGTEPPQIGRFESLQCHPYVEQIVVGVNLTWPELLVNPSNPPAPLSNTSKRVSNSYAFPDSYLLDGDTDSSTQLAPKYSYDPFTNYVINGRNGIPLTDLLDNNTMLIEAVERTYGIYFAQLLRTSNAWSTAPANATRLPATFTFADRHRLVQHGISTRLLEGILAAMFLCAVIAYTSIWRDTKGTRRILPKSPYTIASTASLFAGAELLETVPEGVQHMSKKQMRAAGIFKGCDFSLGWWDDRQRFGIDVGQADARNPPASSGTSTLGQEEEGEAGSAEERIGLRQRNIEARNSAGDAP